jgi:predicted DNA-binding protein (UPF0251 family)
MPEVTYFKPAGIPLRVLEESRLSVEEVEAIRLKDLDGLEQEECASKMNISRQTFQRVLGSARRNIADALLNSKAIRIEGGNFEMSPHLVSWQPARHRGSARRRGRPGPYWPQKELQQR